MLTKHTSHECKECNEKLPSVTKLLKHVADNHYEVQGNVQNRTPKEDTTENIEANSINKEGIKDKEKVLCPVSQGFLTNLFEQVLK